ncbi:MAG: DUF1566 domain-containing protein [Azoarcus sp.]|jgi:hypothetical protein|nr:DUF1566 domain-containing protein [Azoarcus sp.]
MEQHKSIKLSVLGVLAGMTIAVTAPANAANNKWIWPAPVYPPQSSCPVGSYVVPGGAYKGPAFTAVGTSSATPASKLGSRLSQFSPDGDLCVFPYDGPFATSWVNASAICRNGLIGGLQWRLPNEREVFEIFQRGFHKSLGMTAGTALHRYWSSSLSLNNPPKAFYVLASSGNHNDVLSLGSQPTHLNGLYIAFRCVKPAKEFASVTTDDNDDSNDYGQ